MLLGPASGPGRRCSSRRLAARSLPRTRLDSSVTWTCYLSPDLEVPISHPDVPRRFPQHDGDSVIGPEPGSRRRPSRQDGQANVSRPSSAPVATTETMIVISRPELEVTFQVVPGMAWPERSRRPVDGDSQVLYFVQGEVEPRGQAGVGRAQHGRLRACLAGMHTRTRFVGHRGSAATAPWPCPRRCERSCLAAVSSSRHSLRVRPRGGRPIACTYRPRPVMTIRRAIASHDMPGRREGPRASRAPPTCASWRCDILPGGQPCLVSQKIC